MATVRKAEKQQEKRGSTRPIAQILKLAKNTSWSSTTKPVVRH